MTQAIVEDAIQPNGINLPALVDTIEAIQNDPEKGKVQFHVTSAWKGQTKIESTVDSYTLGGKKIPRSHKMVVDEPFELLGNDEAPNPQEMLFAALNSCLITGYSANAAVMGIQLTKLEVETEGEIDLRGYLDLDDSVVPGYKSIQYTVRIQGDGTPDQFDALHKQVHKTWVNGYNLANPVKLNATLVVE